MGRYYLKWGWGVGEDLSGGTAGELQEVCVCVCVCVCVRQQQGCQCGNQRPGGRSNRTKVKYVKMWAFSLNEKGSQEMIFSKEVT